MALTAWFDDLSLQRASTVGEVGEKAAELGELSRAGVPVPPGFVVTAEAARAFFANEELARAIERVASARHDPILLEAASTSLGGLVRTTELPEELEEALVSAYHALSDPALGDGALVAVRASIDERRVDAHVPTMLATTLDVRGERALVDAVRASWASIFALPVLRRLIAAGLLDERPHLHLGVVVQDMIDADKSGLAFSVDPESGDPAVVVVEGTFGLSEPLLRGAIEPDRFVLDKARLELRHEHIGDKRVEVIHEPEHARRSERRTPADRAHARSLDDREIRAIAALARKSEGLFRGPRALEFAIAGSALFAIETRPVTHYRAV